MMKIKDIVEVIEQSVPLSAQESYDNAGLIVGNREAEVEVALLCVDVTEQVIDEALTIGAGLIISHHPVIFNPIKRLTGANYVERIVERAITEGIALYAAHTNLDAIQGGMSYRLAEILGVGQLRLLSPTRGEGTNIGFGVVGELAQDVDAVEFMRLIKQRLNLSVVRHSDVCVQRIRRVAICTGAGASLIATAKQVEADMYIAADFKYNDFMDADSRIIVADIGHFESEYCAIDLLYDIITKKLSTFALRKSVNSRNPINYLV